MGPEGGGHSYEGGAVVMGVESWRDIGIQWPIRSLGMQSESHC